MDGAIDCAVRRDEWRQSRFTRGPVPLPDAPGQVCFRVDRFALTSNNITYALIGDMLGYWTFFPAEAPWGHIPVMGFDRRNHYPQQLSGGEMQRAAIARAVVHGPALLIADEPTGNLDSVNGARVLELLRELNGETAVTILLATHASEIGAAAKRIIQMRDGRIEL